MNHCHASDQPPTMRSFLLHNRTSFPQRNRRPQSFAHFQCSIHVQLVWPKTNAPVLCFPTLRYNAVPGSDPDYESWFLVPFIQPIVLDFNFFNSIRNPKKGLVRIRKYQNIFVWTTWFNMGFTTQGVCIGTWLLGNKYTYVCGMHSHAIRHSNSYYASSLFLDIKFPETDAGGGISYPYNYLGVCTPTYRLVIEHNIFRW